MRLACTTSALWLLLCFQGHLLDVLCLTNQISVNCSVLAFGDKNDIPKCFTWVKLTSIIKIQLIVMYLAMLSMGRPGSAVGDRGCSLKLYIGWF